MAPHQQKVSLKRKVTLRKKQPSSTPSPQKQDPKPNRRRTWIVVVVVAIALLGGGYLLFNNSGDTQLVQSPEPVASETTSRPKQPESDSATTLDEEDVATTETSDPHQSTEPKQDGATPTSPKQTEESGYANSPESAPAEGTAEAEPSKATGTSSTARQPHTTTATARDSSSRSIDPNKSVDEVALDVIRGLYGNGTTRQENLGTRYAEIQQRVNEMCRSLGL